VIGLYLPEAVREFVRAVRADPPHEPEPHPDEPFAPVYDFTPLGAAPFDKYAHWLPVPRDPDPLVFGDPYGQPRHDPSGGYAPWGCVRCDVRWAGGRRCWHCGAVETAI